MIYKVLYLSHLARFQGHCAVRLLRHSQALAWSAPSALLHLTQPACMQHAPTCAGHSGSAAWAAPPAAGGRAAAAVPPHACGGAGCSRRLLHRRGLVSSLLVAGFTGCGIIFYLLQLIFNDFDHTRRAKKQTASSQCISWAAGDPGDHTRRVQQASPI